MRYSYHLYVWVGTVQVEHWMTESKGSEMVESDRVGMVDGAVIVEEVACCVDENNCVKNWIKNLCRETKGLVIKERCSCKKRNTTRGVECYLNLLNNENAHTSYNEESPVSLSIVSRLWQCSCQQSNKLAIGNWRWEGDWNKPIHHIMSSLNCHIKHWPNHHVRYSLC